MPVTVADHDAMAATRMHQDEVDTDATLVRQLLADQFPQWASMPVTRVESFGTDHAIYRLGETLSARLPRIGWATGQSAKEAEWLPRLAPHLPVALPTPRAMGQPGRGYPYTWSICDWLPGRDASHSVDDPERLAVDVAAFIRALQGIDASGAFPRPPGARGGPPAEGDQGVRRAVATLGTRIDAAAVLRSWQESLEAAAWSGRDVWVHGDLLPGNLLLTGGRLSGVIDFGGLNVGDPACDLQAAWNVFSGRSRDVFRSELDVDDAAWLRGRGWALRQAVVALPYYWDTNPGIVRQASYALAQVLTS